MSEEYLEKLKELLVNEVVLSNNKLLLLTGTFNYYIDTMKIELEKHKDISYIKDTLERKLEECGLPQDTKQFLKTKYQGYFEELIDLKHDFISTELHLQNKEVSYLIEGLKHFIKQESKRRKRKRFFLRKKVELSQKYFEIKDYLEGILKEGSK